jgi:hypothetical protein
VVDVTNIMMYSVVAMYYNIVALIGAQDYLV